ncbi:MAG: hypothetical protein NW220_13365 [Leptolyngbyaceae cyanobacterium bins.349]|nr:hypothetical protein [Leptolyngbyaceae cyanobacterium bins.349]
MTHSNKVLREAYGFTIGWSVLTITTLLLISCPEFVESTLRGEFEPALMVRGIQRQLATLQALLGKSRESTAPGQSSTHNLFGEVGNLGPGAIAIGNAEGTLRPNGTPTWAYYGHSDPANQVTNKGFASWQATRVKTAKEGDRQALRRINTQCIPYTVKSFQAQGLDLTPRLLVESCDIWIQAPRAAVDFAWNYKQCQLDGKTGERALLCARINNYIDPATGRFDVASIFKKPGALAADQQRRMTAIAQTLKRFQISPTI